MPAELRVECPLRPSLRPLELVLKSRALTIVFLERPRQALPQTPAWNLQSVFTETASPVLHVTSISRWLIVLFLYVLCITTALSFGSQKEKFNNSSSDNRGLSLQAGICEGGETGVAYSLFLLFPEKIFQLLSLWIVMLGLTIVIRTQQAYKILDSAPR